MTQAPETDLWGPGDYGPDFVTIDDMLAPRFEMETSNWGKLGWDIHFANIALAERRAARDFALDLAHDLDERGLVLMSEDEIEEQIGDAYSEGVRQGASDQSEQY